MINTYDEVKIISNGATGTVIDIDSKGMLTVEGHKGETKKDSVYGNDFPLYYVATTDVETIGIETPEDLQRAELFLSKQVGA